jgi:hypothetical protein
MSDTKIAPGVLEDVKMSKSGRAKLARLQWVLLINTGARTMSEIQDEIDRNYAAFVAILPTLIASHREQYALMKGGKILGFYSTAVDARTAAESFIDDKLYSIQKVTDSAVDLGYFSHAMHSCAVQS